MIQNTSTLQCCPCIQAKDVLLRITNELSYGSASTRFIESLTSSGVLVCRASVRGVKGVSGVMGVAWAVYTGPLGVFAALQERRCSIDSSSGLSIPKNTIKVEQSNKLHRCQYELFECMHSVH